MRSRAKVRNPSYTGRCEGSAQGSGITYDKVILINLHEELRHLARPYSKKLKPDHCTAVATAPSDSGDGHTYNGQTWDWMVSVAGMSEMVEWQREDATSVVAYGFPGMPMGAGINANGVTLCWTSALVREMPRVGVPSYLIVGHLLAQPNVTSVIREANRNKQAGIFTFVMTEADGNLLNVEGSPQAVAIEQPTDRLARAQHKYDLLAETAGKNDREMLQRYFTERECEIVQWNSSITKTIDIMLFDSTARKAYLTRGPDFHLEWREFAFHDAK